MKKIMILTSMRVGSTWMCYFFSYAFGKMFEYVIGIDKMERAWKKTPVIKVHRFKSGGAEGGGDLFDKATATKDTIARFPDAYIITSVRNPKGRISSQIHFRPPVEARIERIIDQGLEWSNLEQFSRMLEGYSTRAPLEGREYKYIWTTYEWLLEDPCREYSIILKFIGERHDEEYVKSLVERAQREQIQRGRIRKGRLNSWEEEKFADRLDVFDEHEKKYYDIIDREITLDK